MHHAIRLLLLFLTVLPGITAPLAQEKLSSLSFLTEEYPPFNFTRDGKVQGIAVDLLLSAAALEGQSISRESIRVYPWTRAYAMALRGHNMVLFSTTRTEEREPLFHWVGPIAPMRIVLIALKQQHIHVESLADLQNKQIGVVTNDIGEEVLTQLGLADQLQPNASADLLLKMMARGRIDLWAYEETVAKWLIKESGMSFDDFEVVYLLREAELYYAFSRDVPEALRVQLQHALDTLKTPLADETSSWATITQKYLH
ncbi:ABC transporter substrate-binding protein [Shewanella sp. FJAT-52076]|uniref:substrate-binding periplasmic protein n=1 Tax=Shewanella sp. FJAT-52076 TaxID=2864202 RepID=UPI001C65E463|nr:transporter substrate-binding domain-containing protein [Shewanella sp. FJAT-52076]QYJ75827.1 transporter substrate-binding domain-containing protein [Shewanella sp. FJAT-52076]